MGKQNGAVVVHMNESISLIEMDGSERNAVLCRDQADPALLPAVRRIESRDLLDTACIISLDLDLVHDQRDVKVSELLAIDARITLFVQVHPAQLID
jgi:hypothetical protein